MARVSANVWRSRGGSLGGSGGGIPPGGRGGRRPHAFGGDGGGRRRGGRAHALIVAGVAACSSIAVANSSQCATRTRSGCAAGGVRVGRCGLAWGGCAHAAATVDLETDGDDDISKIKRILKSVLKDVVGIRDRLDGISGAAPHGRKWTSSALDSATVRAVLRSRMKIDDNQDAASGGSERSLIKDAKVEDEYGMEISVSSPLSHKNAIRCDFVLNDVTQNASLKLKKLVMEFDDVAGLQVKMAPFGAKGHDMLNSISPFLHKGLMPLTSLGPTLYSRFKGVCVALHRRERGTEREGVRPPPFRIFLRTLD